MGKRERTWATIPPYFPNILLGYICIQWGMVRCREHMLDFPELFLFAAGALLLVGGCMHCTICPKGLVVQFLWIPYRLIRWDNVGNAEYMTRWFHSNRDGNSGRFRHGKFYIGRLNPAWSRTGKAWVTGSGIFVTTMNCPGFFAELDSMLLFRLKHPVGAFFFRFLPFRRELYVSLFLRYFPELELPVEMLVSQYHEN